MPITRLALFQAIFALLICFPFPSATVASDPASAANRSDVSAPCALQFDIDGDGRLDEATALENRIELRVGSQIATLPQSAEQLSAADVDADGQLDLVLDGNRWILNPHIRQAWPGGPAGPELGSLNLAPVWDSSATYLESTTRQLIADLDGDGRMDLVTGDYNGPSGSDVATLRVFENTADDTWTEVWSFSEGPRIWNGFALADTDEDDRIELVAAKIGGSYLGGPYVGPRVYIFESNGDNSYAFDHLIEVDPTPAGAAFSLVDDIAVGNANGDGHPDIAVGLADNETLFTSTWGSRLYLFDYDAGSSAYIQRYTTTRTNSGIGYLTAIDIGDSDNDGEPEIVFFERIVPNILRAEFNGASFVVKSNSSGVPAGVCLDTKVVDANADGQNELLCGTAAGANGHVHIFKPTGNDAYSVGFEDSAGIGNTVLYVATDNRTPPTLAGAAHSNHALVLRWNAASTLYEQLDFFSVAGSIQLHEVSFGRLDGDCSLDVMFTRFNGTTSSGVYEQRESAAPCCTGDIDVDCDVDFVDLDLFVAVLLGTDTDPGHLARSDINGDTTANGSDIPAFTQSILAFVP